MRGRCALIAAMVSVAEAQAQQAPSVAVRLDPPTATVGDLVTATIEVAGSPGVGAGEPTFPTWGERWGEAEIASAGDVVRDGAAARQTLTLRAFRVGTIGLPSVAITLDSSAGRLELRTPTDLAIEVKSVLPPAEPGQSIAPQPGAPPRPLPIGDAFWWTAGGALALCLLAAALLWRSRRRDLWQSANETALPPLAELEAALAALRADPSAAEPAHADLSAVLRRYLGRRFAFPALESTTTEIRAALATRAAAPGERTAASDFLTVLRAADHVKFARRPATRGELEERIDRVVAACRGLDAQQPPAEAAA